MQLNRCGVAAALGILAAGLLGVAPASAEDANSGLAAAETGSGSRPNAYDQTASEVGTVVADTALLVYQEDDDRVRAIESEVGLAWNPASGIVVSSKLTYASISCAKPNGAVRLRYDQTVVPPRRTRFIGAGKDQGCLARTDVFNGSRSVSLTSDLRETFL
ncbi:MAG: hypothetical protein ACKVOL_03130 [Novosphingobium sp.]